MSTRTKVLMDSSFLLPTLGMEVKEITEEDLKLLSKLRTRMEIHCLHQSLLEILGKITKGKYDKLEKSAIQIGLRSLLETGEYKWVNPSVEALMETIELRKKGHRDLIDNMLYTTAKQDGMYLLSLDQDLIRFLKNNNYDTKLIVNTKQLAKTTT